MNPTSKVDPEAVRWKAVEIASEYPEAVGTGFTSAQMAGIHSWIRDNIKYVPDPVTGDYFASPEETLKTGAGDCDCQAILAASMYAALGAGVRLLDVRSDQGKRHLFPQIKMTTEEHRVRDEITDHIRDAYDSHWNRTVSTISWSKTQKGIFFDADPILSKYIGDRQAFKKRGYFSNQRWYDMKSYRF